MHAHGRLLGAITPYVTLLDDCEQDLVYLTQAKAVGKVPDWLPAIISLDDAITDTMAMVHDLRTHLARICKDPGGKPN